MKTDKEFSEFYMGIRSLFRPGLTKDEAEDGWVEIIMMDMHGIPMNCQPLYHSLKDEFVIRMGYMGLGFHNIKKTIKAVDEYVKGIAFQNNPLLFLGRYENVNDDL